MEAGVRRFRVPLASIAYVRMIVEAYEGLAVMVSPEAGRGLIEWWVAPGREAEADQLAAALAAEVGLVALPHEETPRATAQPGSK